MKIIITVFIYIICVEMIFTQSQNQLNFPTADVNTVVIANITGDVEVQIKSDANQIELKALLEQSNKKLLTSIESKMTNDSLIIYIDHPCATLQLTEPKNHKGWYSGIYIWSDECKSPEEKIDLDLSIPEGIAVSAWTINKGDIEISDVTEILNCKNVNGDISLSGVTNLKEARTTNGDITVDYNANPTQDSKIYSLNGTVTVLLDERPDIIASFKSNYGNLFTNIENAIPLPYSWVREDSSQGTKFKIEGRSRFQYGKGHTTLFLETFNGDIFLKKKSESNF